MPPLSGGYSIHGFTIAYKGHHMNSITSAFMPNANNMIRLDHTHTRLAGKILATSRTGLQHDG